MKKDVYAFWEWIEERMAELGISSMAELERLAGASVGAINKRKNAFKFPTVEAAEGICRALQVSWVELWTRAGFVQHVDKSQLVGLDAEIYHALQNVGEDFKRSVFETIKTWLILYEELKRQEDESLR